MPLDIIVEVYTVFWGFSPVIWDGIVKSICCERIVLVSWIVIFSETTEKDKKHVFTLGSAFKLRDHSLRKSSIFFSYFKKELSIKYNKINYLVFLMMTFYFLKSLYGSHNALVK